MKNLARATIVAFGATEIIIGVITIVSLVVAKLFFDAAKPFPVFLFVSLTALCSLLLGIGIISYSLVARKLLIFFAGYIVLTKIFIWSGLIHLSPPFETIIPSAVKNAVSFAYHILLIALLGSEKVRREFL